MSLILSFVEARGHVVESAARYYSENL